MTTPSGMATSPRSFTVLIPPTVAITSPGSGASVLTEALTVQGTVNANGVEVGVAVNGVPAMVQAGTFAATIPVTPDTTSLTAVATTFEGATASHQIPLTVTGAVEGTLWLHPFPGTGLAPLY